MTNKRPVDMMMLIHAANVRKEGSQEEARRLIIMIQQTTTLGLENYLTRKQNPQQNAAIKETNQRRRKYVGESCYFTSQYVSFKRECVLDFFIHQNRQILRPPNFLEFQFTFFSRNLFAYLKKIYMRRNRKQPLKFETDY